MKYYIIVGEASGDLHASNLVKAIKANDPSAEFRGWGGDKMKDEGVELVKHYKEVAYMGFSEVIKHLPTIFKNLKACKEDIIQYNPDVVIPVDYPGFNLRIAEFTHEQKIKTVYYISPQVWAWKEGRVKKIKKLVDRLMVILPFEKDFYKKHNMEVDFVGHPLLDVITDNDISTRSENIIAVLPGSREQEISKMLPLMLKMKKHFGEYEFHVAKAPSLNEDYYSQFLKEGIHLHTGSSYDLLKKAKAALVTSGTATLETALFKVPQVVCYKGSAISYNIAKKLVKINYISLVNLIMDKEVVTELIQSDFNEKRLKKELDAILNDSENTQAMLDNYSELRNKLGNSGASANAARLILSELQA
ncbi:MAG: lipid-A-disaccharide synthase [Bacteroidia bacterium]|nr:lipid-A-disaccharide synthase [Bacteroidia bacterium]NNC86322.1 lipid-A-disaccharide synthase [Bacteroidia bacterium]NNM15463.1 lipid-A-disaccharide synthase [Bacteroidia bacterium]